VLRRDVLAQLPTPCLIIDVAAADRNIARAELIRGSMGLRPHFKAHKCTRLLQRQIPPGGGVTCATAYEAVRLADAGFHDILIANEIVNVSALRALVDAAGTASLTVAVDAEMQVELLQAHVSAANVRVDVLIDIDVGFHRCGVRPMSDELPTIGRAIARSSHLNLVGLMAYEGHAMHESEPAVRRRLVTRATQLISAERRRMRDLGWTCSVISGAGTGTFEFAVEAGLLTEAQIGSYVLMDRSYVAMGLPFEPALWCLATVISKRSPGEAVLDAGLKSLSGEQGLPGSATDGVEVTELNDEHSIVRIAPGRALMIGDVVPLVPGHVDPTMNLHDSAFAIDAKGEFESWPIDGRRSTLPA
jgi:D-threonine aldolase